MLRDGPLDSDEAYKILGDRFQIAADPDITSRTEIVQDGIRSLLRIAAARVIMYTEPSREASIAIIKLEEALMWAGKAIYKNEN